MDIVATKIGIRELRDTLTATIRRVQRGETIQVTHHGSPVAVLAPVPADRVERLIASGEMSPATTLDHKVQRHPAVGAQSASEALQEDRAAR